jgi:flavin reductase (DIM6/NTAB) family NADH-FMN oxidoreductase RutF
MAAMPNAAPTDLALALGRIPSGLFVVTTRRAGAPLGFVGSFVQQVGFEPPTVLVAVGKGRAPLEAIRSSRAFALSVLDPASERLMGRFFKRYEPGQSPFDGLTTFDAPSGSPVLSEALAWVDCQLSGEHELPDHVVMFGTVSEGRMLREGDPSVHLRRNGLTY